MNLPQPARLVPPRPIPEPLPWPEPSTIHGPWIVAITLVLLAVVALLVIGLRRKRKRRPPVEPEGLAPPSTPDSLIGRAERIRSALVSRFGESWSARTTEEIAGSTALSDLLGAEMARAVVEYLRLADRAKFATAPAIPAITTNDEHNDAWLAEILARLAAG